MDIAGLIRSGGRLLPQVVLTVALLTRDPAAVAAQAPSNDAGGAGRGGPPSQVGRVVGRIVDAESGRPLPSAQVYIPGTEIGSLTDLDGRYVLRRVPAGTWTIAVQTVGYGTKRVTDVEVAEGEVTRLDITAEQQAVEVEGITVSAARERGSSAFLLDQRRNASSLVEAVGSAEISRRPDSDAADVAQRMTGVTVTDGKYVFVRGLGERYSQTTLNGSSLPSPEPDKEVVPLDLFPAGFLESLETQKSYTPDLPADFSGGSVQINTKDFPSRFTVKVGVGTSLNTRSAFSGHFLETPGAGTTFFGFDDGSRDFPAEVQSVLGGVRGEPLPTDPATRIAVARAFQQHGLAFEPVSTTAPMNRSFDLSIGGSKDVMDEGEVGYFLAGTYSDEYVVRDDEVERKYFATAFDPATPADLRLANVDYTFQRGTREIAWGTIGNVTFKPTPSQKISFRTTVNLNTEEEARAFEGLNSEDIGGRIRSTRARFVERLLLWSQLSGEHGAFADSRFDWRVTAARADRDEPWLREAIYLESDDEFLLLDGDTSGRLFWSDLVDDDLSGELDWRLPFGFFGRDASVKMGAAHRTRSRDFAARRLQFEFLGSLITDIDAALDTARIVETVRRPGEFGIKEVQEPGNEYDVSDDRSAGYLMFELPLSESLEMVFGARVETYDLQVNSRIANRDTLLTDRSQTDVAPSASLIWTARPDVEIRVAASRTTDRPEFRELAPFQFTEATSLRQIVGNPSLKTADIMSADLRADWFFGPGELLSVGGFYKTLDHPIELVFLGAASSAYQFTNAVDATLLGLELDATVGLRRLGESLEDFTWQGNFSWIDSEVSVERIGAFNPTNLDRPLVGQAPYVLNTSLNWAASSGWEAGVFFNRFGERLEAAGGSGVPDIYEQPRNSLDATLGFPLPRGVRARIKGSNLLDSPFEYEQSATGITLLQRRYEVGRTFSVGLSWEF